jgi:Protein of unknown function (DUF3352)
VKVKVLVAITATVLLAGAAALIAYGFLYSPATDEAITLVPEDSIGYFNVFLAPSNSQKQAIESLIAKTPFDTPEDLFKKVTDGIDKGLEEQGCSYKEDFEPWVGNQLAGFLSGPEDGLLFIATKDAGAALSTFEKCGDVEGLESRSYKGVDYEADGTNAVGIVENYLAAGTEEALKKMIDTSQGAASLESSESYKDAVDDLTDDPLALFYIDVKAVLEELRDSAGFSGPEAAFLDEFYESLDRPISASIFARSNAIVFEYSAGLPASDVMRSLDLAGVFTSDVVAELPGGSWGALGIGSAGEYVDSILDFAAGFDPTGGREAIEAEFAKETGLSLSKDLLSWIGDVGFFVQGTSPLTLSGGAVIETTDAEASQLAIAKLAEVAEANGVAVRPLTIPGVEGFAIQEKDQPQPINVVAGAEKVVIAFGNLATEQALRGDVTLEDSKTFIEASDALGPGFTVSAFFEADPIQGLVESSVLPTLQTFDPTTGQVVPDADAQTNYQENVRPFIDPLSFLVSGTRIEDDTSITRLVIGVE